MNNHNKHLKCRGNFQTHLQHPNDLLDSLVTSSLFQLHGQLRWQGPKPFIPNRSCCGLLLGQPLVVGGDAFLQLRSAGQSRAQQPPAACND